jgi:predicted GNAT family acetyltransferase
MSSAPLGAEVVHDAAQERFELAINGLRGVLEYRRVGSVMSILHTEVPEALRGRGLAARLTDAALAQARAAGWTVRPQCAYARVHMRRHPETADLLAGAPPQ